MHYVLHCQNVPGVSSAVSKCNEQYTDSHLLLQRFIPDRGFLVSPTVKSNDQKSTGNSGLGVQSAIRS